MLTNSVDGAGATTKTQTIPENVLRCIVITGRIKMAKRGQQYGLWKVFAGWLVALLVASTAAQAFDAASVPALKRTKLGQYLSSKEAAKFMDKNAAKALFLDVRTTPEVAFLGMPTQADANVPYMREPDFPVWDAAKENFKLELNPDF